MTKKTVLGMGKAMSLSGIFFILIQGLAAHSAQAWGHTKNLIRGWAESQLVTSVIERNQIDYCLEIEDPRFEDAGIARQIEAALSVWLKPLEVIGVNNTTIQRSTCEVGAYSLKVIIGRETNFTTLGSYQLPEQEEGNYYSLVKIDPAFTSTKAGKSYHFVDFASLITPGQSLDATMQSVSILRPSSVQAFATTHSLDFSTVYWSTYRVLLHELGHSFGLCDTYVSQLSECDPHFMSSTQPSSVMHDSLDFFLAADDIAGIQTLFTRFMH